MSTAGQRYAVGIGTGAAGGAAAGTAILPGWGTAIGAGVGAIGGAIGAGIAGAKENAEHDLLAKDEARKRKAILLSILRDQAAEAGLPTTELDTKMAINGLDYENAARERQFTAEHRIDPMSFVPIAQMGTQAAGGIYNSMQADAQRKQLQLQLGQLRPTQIAPIDSPQSFQLSKPGLLEDY